MGHQSWLAGSLSARRVQPSHRSRGPRPASERKLELHGSDWKLLSEMLNEEGAAFAEKYCAAYIKDYQRVLAKGLSSDYSVDDSTANQSKIAAVFDQRFKQWKRGPWGKFW
jgi:hypothetical protein